MPSEITKHIELDIPGLPEVGGSDHMSFVCKPVPFFRYQSNYPDYRQYTWHTNLDTFDKIVFDDLRNNATLAAMTAYIIPVVAVIAGALILEETITLGMLSGMALILLGVAIINQRRRVVQAEPSAPVS